MSEVFGDGCRVISNDPVQGDETCVFTKLVCCEMIGSENDAKTRIILDCLVFADDGKGIGVGVDALNMVGTVGHWR